MQLLIKTIDKLYSVVFLLNSELWAQLQCILGKSNGADSKLESNLNPFLEESFRTAEHRCHLSSDAVHCIGFVSRLKRLQNLRRYWDRLTCVPTEKKLNPCNWITDTRRLAQKRGYLSSSIEVIIPFGLNDLTILVTYFFSERLCESRGQSDHLKLSPFTHPRSSPFITLDILDN